MPAFNGEPYIGAAIRSVLAQSYARWELLILDDGSADRTAEIAEAFEKSDPRIRLFRNPKNLGAAQTRNRGFALAQGEWIALLDCDDAYFLLCSQFSISYSTAIITASYLPTYLNTSSCLGLATWSAATSSGIPLTETYYC